MTEDCNTAVVLRKEGSGLTTPGLRAKKIRLLNEYARMAELADAPDSKSGSRKRVGVRPSLWAPTNSICYPCVRPVVASGKGLIVP